MNGVAQFLHNPGAKLRLVEPVGDVESFHRVLGVQDKPLVFRRDAQVGELFRQRGSPDEQRYVDTGVFQILRRHDHLLRGFHKQARQADGVGPFTPVRLDQLFRRHLDAKIDHPIAIIG